jgi:acetolactate decarboxylase
MQISVDIPASLKSALEEKAGTSGGVSAVVTAALARYLEKPIHTIFQVSTSGALVAGVYESEVSVRTLLEHGDFGLGTFADLNGEMVIVDGRAYQIQGSGSVSEASAGAGAPFAVVTWFEPSIDVSIRSVGTFKELEASCDPLPTCRNLLATHGARAWQFRLPPIPDVLLSCSKRRSGPVSDIHHFERICPSEVRQISI